MNVTTSIHRLVVESPIGLLLVTGDGGTVTRLDLECPEGSEHSSPGAPPEPLVHAAAQLEEYFAGARTAFELPLALSGTLFQQAVWRALATIPYGSTVSYADLAARVGRPGAQRAVGRANGANPLPIFLPCHRVVAADGGLGGYRGGLAVKRQLLALEGAPVETGGPRHPRKSATG